MCRHPFASQKSLIRCLPRHLSKVVVCFCAVGTVKPHPAKNLSAAGPASEWVSAVLDVLLALQAAGEEGPSLPPGPRPGPPAKEYPFPIDPFQQTAVNCLEAGACGVHIFSLVIAKLVG